MLRHSKDPDDSYWHLMALASMHTLQIGRGRYSYPFTLYNLSPAMLESSLALKIGKNGTAVTGVENGLAISP